MDNANLVSPFIALIHCIQWTFANPVVADWPTKWQKKPSCVSTGWGGLVLCIRQVAHRTSFLSRQRDIMTPFVFGACSVETDFCEFKVFWYFFCCCLQFIGSVLNIMSSPGQKRGGCGHLMARFGIHNYCERSGDKGYLHRLHRPVLSQG